MGNVKAGLHVFLLLEIGRSLALFHLLKGLNAKTDWTQRWQVPSTTGKAPLTAVANFPCFLAPEMVPSRMSNVAVGLWSGLNDLRDGSGEAFFLRCLGALRFVVLTCQGCVCGSGG